MIQTIAADTDCCVGGLLHESISLLTLRDLLYGHTKSTNQKQCSATSDLWLMPKRSHHGVYSFFLFRCKDDPALEHKYIIAANKDHISERTHKRILLKARKDGKASKKSVFTQGISTFCKKILAICVIIHRQAHTHFCNTEPQMRTYLVAAFLLQLTYINHDVNENEVNKSTEVVFMKTHMSEHYVFSFRSGSVAERDINHIAKEQERCFERICATLKISFDEKIYYYLLDSPKEVGKVYGELYGPNMPLNGFAAWGENKIYAVYNEKVKCIGAHEDAHIISYVISAPMSGFIVEGLAMYFDEEWWGIPNEIWAAYYRNADNTISVIDMLKNDCFYELDDVITYPIAGAFTKHLIDTYGIDKYLDIYRIEQEICCEDFARIHDRPIAEIENRFWEEMMKVKFDSECLKALITQNQSAGST